MANVSKMEFRRFLGVCLAGLAALALGACVTTESPRQPANKTYRLGTMIYSPSFENQAIVVVGLRRTGANTFSYAIAAAQGEKVEGDGTKSWTGFFGSAPGPGNPRLNLAEDELDYHILRVPPGDYAVLRISGGKQYFLVSFERAYNVSSRQTSLVSADRVSFVRTDLIDPVRTPETPIFSARPNEVVYVGDLVFDGRDPDRRTLAIDSSPDGARAALAAFGETRPMEIRAMVRPSGPAPRVLVESTVTPATTTIQNIQSTPVFVPQPRSR